MTKLHVIRHGRASALDADYDQLHAMGELQARALGAHLAREGQRFDAVYVGPLKRQLDTLRLMREAAGAIGAGWPEAHVLDGLAEGPFEQLMKQHTRLRLPADTVLLQHAIAYRGAQDIAARDLALNAIFEHMITLWRHGEVSADDLESAAAFDARVTLALSQITEREGFGREVAVVTSNGVIGAWVERAQRAAATPKPDGLRVHNSSVSQIELRADGLLLHAYNVTSHLTDPEHLTVL